MGIYEKSPLAVALEEHYKEHPIDDSFEGILAHYSGMSVERVQLALQALDDAMFAAEYDPSTRYPQMQTLANQTFVYPPQQQNVLQQEFVNILQTANISLRKEAYLI